MGRLGVTGRPAGGGDRYGGQCGTVRPGRRRRGGPPRPLPAHAALAYADGELPRPVPPGLSLAFGAGSHLWPLGSLVAVLAHARGPAPRRQGRSDLARPTSFGQ